MSPKVPDDYLEARRMQIVDAAIRCFARKGFRRTTMQDIFDESGLSAGAVYNYFKGKEDILEAMAAVSRDRNRGLVEAALLPEVDDPIEAAYAPLFAHLGEPEARAYAALDLEIFSESTRNETIAESLHESYESAMDAFARLVEHAQKQGRFPTGLKSSAIAQVLSALFYGGQILSIMDPDADFAAYNDVCRTILRGEFKGENR